MVSVIARKELIQWSIRCSVNLILTAENAQRKLKKASLYCKLTVGGHNLRLKNRWRAQISFSRNHLTVRWSFYSVCLQVTSPPNWFIVHSRSLYDAVSRTNIQSACRVQFLLGFCSWSNNAKPQWINQIIVIIDHAMCRSRIYSLSASFV